MDVSVATMSKGQRTFEKTKEKTKNNVGLITTGALGIGATAGTGKLIDKAFEVKDKVEINNSPFKSIMPLSKAEKFFINFTKACETFYDKAEIKYQNSDLGKTVTEMVEIIKKSPASKRGAALILGIVGVTSVIATATKAITTHFKNKQIEQKYN